MLENIQVKTLSSTQNPQKLVAQAMHNDYSEKFIMDEPFWMDLDETKAGGMVVEKCLKYGHFGPVEHPVLILAFKLIPHSVMQQLRTHRAGITFDVQSMRYTSKRFVDWYNRHKGDILSEESIQDYEDLFYLRQPGIYQDRFGNSVDFNYEMRLCQIEDQIEIFAENVSFYLIKNKMPFEMFRDLIPAGYRQNMVVTANARSWMHILDMRLPKNAQLEINYVMELVLQRCLEWMPEVFQYYVEKRKGKNKLAP